MSKGKWVLVGIGVIAVMIIIGTIAGGSETESVEGAALASTATQKATATTKPNATPTVDAKAWLEPFERYMVENFGGQHATSWYKNIKGYDYSVLSSKKYLTIETDLYHKDENKTVARNMVNAAHGYDKALQVKVNASDGLALILWE